MYLTCAQFKALSYHHQARYVLTQGHFLARRRHQSYSIELYALGTFYCECWLEQAVGYRPLYRAFADTQRLGPYLEQVLLPYDFIQ